MSFEVYQKVDQSKFIPVLFERDEEGHPCLPVFLKNRLYIDLSSVEKRYENYEQVLRAILDRPLHKKPRLGTPPAHLFSETAAHPSTRYHIERVRDALVDGKPQSVALVRDYLRRKVEELDSYRINIHASAHAYDDDIVDGIKSMLPYRDELVEFFGVLVEYKSEPQIYEEIAEFFQSALAYHFRPEDTNNWTSVSADNFKFISYELFLYFVGVLIKARRFAEADQFLRHEFFVVDPEGNDRFWSFPRIRPYFSSLEEHRKQRLKLNRVSVTADLLKERAGRGDAPPAVELRVAAAAA